MSETLRVDLWDLAAPLARTFDMMSPPLADHSLRVAYIALRIAEELGLPVLAQREIVLAGVLHDIGAFSLGERLDLLEFELRNPGEHSLAGALLLRTFEPFTAIADLVEFHHYPWDQGQGRDCMGRPVPEGSHLLCLADRMAVLIPPDALVLGLVPGICASIAAGSGSQFVPAHVAALQRLAGKDFVWLDAAMGSVEGLLRRALGGAFLELDLDGLLAFARLLCRIIDFKSAFTATHSSSVAAVGRELARLEGFSAHRCTMVEIAACLHDLGKMAVPLEILEKPGKLSPAEWGVMRSHVYHTGRVLNRVVPLGEMATWGSLHQERLDGSGYPFQYIADEIPLGARILAVADVFTGITEDRPYRAGMSEGEAKQVLLDLARKNALDARLVDLLLAHFPELDRLRRGAHQLAVREYREFREALARGACPSAP